MNHVAIQREDSSRPGILVIDMGGTNVKFGYVVDGVPQSFSHLVSTTRLRNAHPVDSLAREAREAIGMHGLMPDIVVCTVPGFLAKDRDLVLHPANIPEMDGHRLATELGSLLGCVVVLERDSNLALLGESVAGVANDGGSVLGVFFGTGIGASLMIDGKLFRGNGWALELGHAPFFGELIDSVGLKHPSIEDYASGRALQGIAARHDIRIAEVFVAGKDNALLAAELDVFVRYQALAVGAAVVMTSPKVIVLGGGVIESENYPKQRLEELIGANSPFERAGLAMDLRWARLGWLSTLHGAPQIVREHDSGTPGTLATRGT